MKGQQVDVRAITDPAASAESGVAHASELIAFAEAALGDDDDALANARERLLEAVGPEALVDAAAVVGNFQRMVRIADGTGIPLDTPVSVLTSEVREELAINDYAGSRNSPEDSALLQTVGRVANPAVGLLLRTIGRFRSGS